LIVLDVGVFMPSIFIQIAMLKALHGHGTGTWKAQPSHPVFTPRLNILSQGDRPKYATRLSQMGGFVFWGIAPTTWLDKA